MAFAGVMTCLPALPASAEIVREETVVRPPSQHLVASVAAAMPVLERSEFVVVEYSVIQWPVPAGSRIGKRFSGGHQGVDLLPGAGTPIHAMTDGVVTEVGNPEGALGVHVTIRHTINGETFFTTYGHMAYGSLTLSVGDSVSTGQVIGAVGSTGASTGPHLHFMVELADGTPINPLPWLAAHVNS